MLAITALQFHATDWDLGIEVEGDFEKEKPTAKRQYFVEFHVDDKEVANSKKETKVAKSTNAESGETVFTWEWEADKKIWFSPSSTITIKIYRKRARLLTSVVGLHKGKVVDLLENDTLLDLTDKKGDPISAKMKMGLSRVSESDSNVKTFMEKVDADVSRLPSNKAIINTASTLGKALQLTKNIMDNLSHDVGDQAHPILKASWTVLSRIYEAVQVTDIQDDSIRELADTLREMLGAANAAPNLPVIADTPNVLEEISRQSLQIASLIDEYTKLCYAARTLKIQISDDLKSRIDESKKSCADLLAKFDRRVRKEIKDGVGRVGTWRFLEVSFWSLRLTVFVENAVTIIKDDQLGAACLLPVSIMKTNFVNYESREDL
ncbi:hypothetical protein BDZ97DRAFT_1764582 [Flammula alnicola]|nr:hypothetical protein BDZ97DRAFT_1764582 [Flammula alnicola]